MSVDVKTVWSGIDVSKTEVFKETLQAQLISQIWSNPALKRELLTNPKTVYARETGIPLLPNINVVVLEESPDVFYFIVPSKPTDLPEALARLEQMSGWWMTAHTWWWWMSRTNSTQADVFIKSLQAMIIGHIWLDESFKQTIQLDPKAALAAEIGMLFPANLQIKIIEETAQTKYLVLPQHPKDRELHSCSEQLSEWWIAAHNWWWWLLWLRVHPEIYSI